MGFQQVWSWAGAGEDVIFESTALEPVRTRCKYSALAPAAVSPLAGDFSAQASAVPRGGGRADLCSTPGLLQSEHWQSRR